MLKLIIAIAMTFGLSNFAQAGVTEALGGQTVECNNMNNVGEGEAVVTATYFEHVIGDKITVRFLKSVAIETEGEPVYSKSYFRPRYIGPEAKDLGDGMSVSIYSLGATVNYQGHEYELSCSVSQ